MEPAGPWDGVNFDVHLIVVTTGSSRTADLASWLIDTTD
jgi:hypothetical protein